MNSYTNSTLETVSIKLGNGSVIEVAPEETVTFGGILIAVKYPYLGWRKVNLDKIRENY